MKRISILVTVTAGFCGMASAGYDTVPFTCRIEYSPHALEYGRSGLLPGCVKYSPYALGSGYSGLVPETVRYSPYAFDTRHSGLISDLGCCSMPCMTWADLFLEDDRRYRSPEKPTGDNEAPRPWATSGTGYPIPAPVSPSRPGSSARTRTADPAETVERNPKRTIEGYLSRTCPCGYEFTRWMSMDGQTVSFDVVLKERNTVVKYWNGTQIQSIKRRGGYRYKAWTNYLTEWIAYRDRFEAAGGKVCHITSDDTFELIRQLASSLQTDP